MTTYRIETHEPVSGLIADSPVELHGVEIGKVTKIELIHPRTVGIRVSVAKNAPISKATVATITSRGLAARGFTGYVYVALENTGAESGPPLIEPGQQYAVIPTAPSLTDTMDTTDRDDGRRDERDLLGVPGGGGRHRFDVPGFIGGV